MNKSFIAALAVGLSALALCGCDRPSDVASYNLSQAADNFEIERRITAINGITDHGLFQVEGRCALGNNDKARELSVVCKVGPTQFKKFFVGLSDNVTFVVEQLEASDASVYHYRVTFNPASLVPDVHGVK